MEHNRASSYLRKSEDSKRVLFLDVVRIVACIMIIMMHAPIPNIGLDGLVLSTDSFLTAPGIGLFIMVSGALLLPVRLSTKEFLRKRLGKVLLPTLFWTLFYWVVAPYTYTVHRGEGVTNFLSIPFSAQFNGVLWFMYMLVGLYLLAPILSGWLERASRREIEFYLGLWGVTLCYPLIRNMISVNEGATGILYYFGGYAGYFLLGYYLHRFGGYLREWLCLVLLMIPIAVAVYCKVYHIEVDFYDMFWYLSILTVMGAVAWFGLLRRLVPEYDRSSKWHRFIVLLSNCCFGIYLCHIFVMRGALWHWEWLRELGGVAQMLVTTFLTFTGSFIMTWLFSLLPGAGYIVGYKHRK